jgi:hypothetical protein
MLRLSLLALLLASAGVLAAEDPFRVLEPGTQPADSRLGPPRTLNGYFPMTVPESREAWEKRRKELREQVLVAVGLWPMPEKTPLNPVVHGKIERDGYTIEKVFFASMPGHYVSGNLYRPKGDNKDQTKNQKPGVLCPHGHWANGRFYEANAGEIKKARDGKGEMTDEGARYPLQARMAMLARMGCVVFHYDMVGVADSKAIAHTAGFTDVDAELRLQSFMGLQTWNSIRALDFLLTLPDVDPKRIGVTGASGGGTQTFMLCAVDDRPTVAFPAVMVSTGMQGGCICENCSYLRQGAGNIDLAALFAPKPLGMVAANDWTKEIETKGLPELKALYRLLGAEENVMARAYLQFDHNYNQVSRELMYNWFNKHLKLDLKEPVEEKPFVPVPPAELSVFDKDHPRPKDEVDAERLRLLMSEATDKQISALLPTDAKSFAEFKRIWGAALRVMIGDTLPAAAEVDAKEVGDKQDLEGATYRRYLLSRKGQGEAIPAVGIKGKEFDGTVVVWIHPQGKASLLKDGKLAPEAKQVLDKKAAILAVDVFLTGEYGDAKAPAIDKGYAGKTFGYNRPLLAQRVHDILTAVAVAKSHEKTKQVHLVGWEAAGPWALLARGLCGDAVARTAVDYNEFRFEKVRLMSDPMLLPGAIKYGGLSALGALTAPHELFDHDHHGTGSGPWMKGVYKASGKPDNLVRNSTRLEPTKVLDWLLR